MSTESKPVPFKIIVDSREQRPYFAAFPGVVAEVGTLPTGDYSLPGFTDKIALERKSLDDLVSCFMGSNRDRFERELARGRAYELFGVIVEADFEDVREHRYTSQMEPTAVMQSIFAFAARYGTPFWWCCDRRGAEYTVHALLSKFLREVGIRYRTAMQGHEAA